jgi:hypothetical protein
MTDIANLWWSPKEGVLTRSDNGVWAEMQAPEIGWMTKHFPADAVKLGDVESLALELHELRMAIAKILDTKQPYVGWHSEEIGNILDRTRGGA